MRRLWQWFARWRAEAAETDAGLYMLAALSCSTSGDGSGALEMRDAARDAIRRRNRWRRWAS